MKPFRLKAENTELSHIWERDSNLRTCEQYKEITELKIILKSLVMSYWYGVRQ